MCLVSTPKIDQKPVVPSKPPIAPVINDGSEASAQGLARANRGGLSFFRTDLMIPMINDTGTAKKTSGVKVPA